MAAGSWLESILFNKHQLHQSTHWVKSRADDADEDAH